MAKRKPNNPKPTNLDSNKTVEVKPVASQGKIAEELFKVVLVLVIIASGVTILWNTRIFGLMKPSTQEPAELLTTFKPKYEFAESKISTPSESWEAWKRLTEIQEALEKDLKAKEKTIPFDEVDVKMRNDRMDAYRTNRNIDKEVLKLHQLACQKEGYHEEPWLSYLAYIHPRDFRTGYEVYSKALEVAKHPAWVKSLFAEMISRPMMSGYDQWIAEEYYFRGKTRNVLALELQREAAQLEPDNAFFSFRYAMGLANQDKPDANLVFQALKTGNKAKENSFPMCPPFKMYITDYGSRNVWADPEAIGDPYKYFAYYPAGDMEKVFELMVDLSIKNKSAEPMVAVLDCLNKMALTQPFDRSLLGVIERCWPFYKKLVESNKKYGFHWYRNDFHNWEFMVSDLLNELIQEGYRPVSGNDLKEMVKVFSVGSFETQMRRKPLLYDNFYSKQRSIINGMKTRITSDLFPTSKASGSKK